MVGSKISKYLRNVSLFFNSRKLIKGLRSDLDTIKSKHDFPTELFDRFYCDRNAHEYTNVFYKENPLVTICIGTFNRGKLLVERSIHSSLNQTYRNIELLVIGDCCTDDTYKLVNGIRDPRLRFINLPERGRYPENPFHRWCVAGTVPFNHALSLAQGDFITHLDDDDEMLPERIEKLVRFIQKEKVELVWHPFWYEQANGRWVLNKAPEFESSKVTTSSVFYHRWFTAIPWDIEAYRYHEPGDWNRLRKFKYLGAQVMRYPEPLLKHYRERNQKNCQ